jgi:hypothetical protein
LCGVSKTSTESAIVYLVKRLKQLETENGRLRRAVSDLTLDKLILTEAVTGNLQH